MDDYKVGPESVLGDRDETNYTAQVPSQVPAVAGLWVVVGFDTPGYDKAGTADPGLEKDLLRYSLTTSPESLPSTPDNKVTNHHSLDIYMEVQMVPFEEILIFFLTFNLKSPNDSEKCQAKLKQNASRFPCTFWRIFQGNCAEVTICSPKAKGLWTNAVWSHQWESFTCVENIGKVGYKIRGVLLPTVFHYTAELNSLLYTERRETIGFGEGFADFGGCKRPIKWGCVRRFLSPWRAENASEGDKPEEWFWVSA
ncbi:hypothetical protein HGM15179_001996 [Zosterops borbonicus]|uniref:Uncharacterized protein n=1 Tax=Zosterops borbonicus TaxID=364589 RepID=A0A8K1GVG6_9PASS|nr:hypothetical protein HGM15179_001996 [Zosterops borbonicus]